MVEKSMNMFISICIVAQINHSLVRNGTFYELGVVHLVVLFIETFVRVTPNALSSCKRQVSNVRSSSKLKQIC